jgi:hypothetical protein
MTAPAVDHLDLVVSSLERSLGFYRGLLQLGCLSDPDGIKLEVLHRPPVR